MEQKVTWKTVQDRYKRLQDQFDESDNEQVRLSGVSGGEMGDLSELLRTMREAWEDFEAKKNAEKDATKRHEQEKERIGSTLVLAATKRGRDKESRIEEAVYDSEEALIDTDVNANKSKKAKRSIGHYISGDIERFGEHLRATDMVRIELDRECLQFEHERYKVEHKERAVKATVCSTKVPFCRPPLHICRGKSTHRSQDHISCMQSDSTGVNRRGALLARIESCVNVLVLP